MKTTASWFCSSVLAMAFAAPAGAIDWITAPSRFTHDAHTGQRVWQYAPVPPVYHTPLATRSVYRQSRSSLQVGDSIDQYHTVDQYGHPVRPYGEWRFPFRPFSVPYPLWGPPYGFGYGFGYGAYGGFGGVGSPYGPFGPVNSAGFPPPWNDGSYPDVQRRQLPPRNFNPGFNRTTNNINGTNNNATTTNNTNSPVNNVPGNDNVITNN